MKRTSRSLILIFLSRTFSINFSFPILSLIFVLIFSQIFVPSLFSSRCVAEESAESGQKTPAKIEVPNEWSLNLPTPTEISPVHTENPTLIYVADDEITMLLLEIQRVAGANLNEEKACEFIEKYEKLKEKIQQKPFEDADARTLLNQASCAYELALALYKCGDRTHAKRYFSETLSLLQKLQLKQTVLSVERQIAVTYMCLAQVAIEEQKFQGAQVLLDRALPIYDVELQKSPKDKNLRESARQMYVICTKFAVKKNEPEETAKCIMRLVTHDLDTIEFFPETEDALMDEVLGAVTLNSWLPNEATLQWSDDSCTKSIENRFFWKRLIGKLEKYAEKPSKIQDFYFLEATIAYTILARTAWNEKDGKLLRECVEKVRQNVPKIKTPDDVLFLGDYWIPFVTAFSAFYDGTPEEMDAACRECYKQKECWTEGFQTKNSWIPNYILNNLYELTMLADQKNRLANLIVFSTQLDELMEKIDPEQTTSGTYLNFVTVRVGVLLTLSEAYLKLEEQQNAQICAQKVFALLQETEDALEMYSVTEEDAKNFEKESVTSQIAAYRILLVLYDEEKEAEKHAEIKNRYNEFVQKTKERFPNEDFTAKSMMFAEGAAIRECYAHQDWKGMAEHLGKCEDLLKSLEKSESEMDPVTQTFLYTFRIFFYYFSAEVTWRQSGDLQKTLEFLQKAYSLKGEAAEFAQKNELSIELDSINQILLFLANLESFDGNLELAQKYYEELLEETRNGIASHPDEEGRITTFLGAGMRFVEFALNAEADPKHARKIFDALVEEFEKKYAKNLSPTTLEEVQKEIPWCSSILLLGENKLAESKELLMNIVQTETENLEVVYLLIARIFLAEGNPTEAKDWAALALAGNLKLQEENGWSRGVRLDLAETYFILSQTTEDEDAAAKHLRDAQAYIQTLNEKYPHDPEILRLKKKICP